MLRRCANALCLFGVTMLCLFTCGTQAQEPLLRVDHQAPESISLTEYFAVLEDPSNRLTLEEVQEPSWAAQFTSGQAPGSSLIYGLTQSSYWLRLHLRNDTDTPQQRLLEINYARLAEVELHYEDANKQPVSWVTGTHYPFITRAYANRGFVFPITLAPRTDHRLYLRVKGVAALEVPARLWLPAAFATYERNDYVFHSIYYGIVIAMVIFNGLVFVLLRERMYLFYVFFVICFALTLAAQNGLANEFLWPHAPLWSRYALAIGYSYTLAALLLFTRSILNTPHLLPRINRLMMFVALLFAISPLGFFLMAEWIMSVAMALNVIASSLILGVGIYCACRGQRSAYFFVAAFMVICTALPINSLRVAGWLPTNLFTVNGLQIGSAIEMMLLAYALADRFNAARRDRELAQSDAFQAQLRLVENLQNSERYLEEQIALRTQELVAKNKELELLSSTDQLTGVFNRLKLTQLLHNEMERSKRYATDLSVLMLDVDHFKTVNDSYGHLAGDSVLVELAELLRKHSRNSDAAGRWGGEEFVVVCPGTDRMGAMNLAETLRGIIASYPFNCPLSLSVSIGVTQFQRDDSLEALLERADNALYTAKHQGRNCVVQY